MNFSKLSLLVLIIIFLTVPQNVAADQIYYYKGTSYDPYVTDDWYGGGTQNSGGSAVVVSAYTSYAGAPGEEKVRGWTRCYYVQTFYQADACVPTMMTLSLTTAEKKPSFISSMDPQPKSYSTWIPDFSWLGRGTWGGVITNITALANGLTTNAIKHYRSSMSEYGSVTFDGGELTKPELPAGIRYSDADKVQDGKRSGVAAYMDFYYDIPTGTTSTFIAGAQARYNVRMSVDNGSAPWTMSVQTGKATVKHTVTGK